MALNPTSDRLLIFAPTTRRKARAGATLSEDAAALVIAGSVLLVWGIGLAAITPALTLMAVAVLAWTGLFRLDGQRLASVGLVVGLVALTACLLLAAAPLVELLSGSADVLRQHNRDLVLGAAGCWALAMAGWLTSRHAANRAAPTPAGPPRPDRHP